MADPFILCYASAQFSLYSKIFHVKCFTANRLNCGALFVLFQLIVGFWLRKSFAFHFLSNRYGGGGASTGGYGGGYGSGGGGAGYGGELNRVHCTG